MLLHCRNIILLLAAGLSSCSKISTFSTTPVITHRSLSYSEQLVAPDPIFVNSPRDTVKIAQLSFTLTDGDGDIGRTNSTSPDSTSPGLHIWLYLPSPKGLISVPDTTFGYLYYQLPEIEIYSTAGQIKTEISVTIDSYRKSLFPHDTIIYRYYTVDKAGHRSNTILTAPASIVTLP